MEAPPGTPGGSADEGRIIVVRKLMALDIYLHGPKFIEIELGVGTPAIFLLGAWLSTSPVSFYLGIFLILTGVNYIPLLIYSAMIISEGSAAKEVERGLAGDRHYNRRYSLWQFIIFIPLSVVLLATYQEISGKART